MYSIACMFMLWRKKTRDFFDQIASMGLTLRLLHQAPNALGTSLSRPLLAVNARARAVFTTVLMQALLPLDRLVRVAAASPAFNVNTWVKKDRVVRVKGKEAIDGIRANEEDEEWEVELVIAVAEALGSEEESQDRTLVNIEFPCARP